MGKFPSDLGWLGTLRGASCLWVLTPNTVPPFFGVASVLWDSTSWIHWVKRQGDGAAKSILVSALRSKDRGDPSSGHGDYLISNIKHEGLTRL